MQKWDAMVTTKNNDKMNAKKYYRVCHKDTFQGLWYNFKGEFTGLIHGQLNFCEANSLQMEFDETIVGWLSAVEDLKDLWAWFSKKDVEQLQKHGWFIHEFESTESRFYERFKHTIIKQDASRVIRVIEI